MTRLASRRLAALAPLLLAAAAHAQPIAGTGCPGALTVTGPPGIKTPGSALFACPASTPGTGVLLIGVVGPSVPVPMPPACAPGPCVLGCTVVITAPMPATGLTINAPAIPAIATLCLQCVAIDATAPCVWLSAARTLRLLPC